MMIPDIRPGMKVTAKMFRDIWEQLRRQRITFSERFTFTETAGGTVVDLANDRNGSSSLIRTGVVTTTISAASSLATYPVTLGSGAAKLDVRAGSTVTQEATSKSVINRAPESYAVGDLLWLSSDDGGSTWLVINRYCPAP